MVLAYSHLPSEWAAALAEIRFGREHDTLDVLFIEGIISETLGTFALGQQVSDAWDQGHSWSEIAVALGVSRQAATKRFRHWTES